MNFGIVLKKGALGILTFLAAYLASNVDMITGLIPESISQLTVGSIAAGLIVAIANWLKNRAKK